MSAAWNRTSLTRVLRGRLVLAVLAGLMLALLTPASAIGAPSVSLTAQPNPAEIGQDVEFAANASADPGATIVEYDWDFGDGTPCYGCGPAASNAYAASGRYTATVTVYDDNGDSATASTTVLVSPAPQASAGADGVQANLYYRTTAGRYNALTVHGERIRIIRQGIIRYDASVPTLGLPCPPCSLIPLGYYGGGKSVQVRDVDGNREPEVLVNVSDAGNICCRYTFVYYYRPQSASYTDTLHNWRDWGGTPPMRDLDRNGITEWVAADTRFRYAFACGTCSAYPIQIWRFASGRFVDVTRHYPRLIARDAASLYRAYLQGRVIRQGFRDVRGILPAYLADEYMLGRGAAGWKVLRAAERAGYLVDYPRFISATEPSPAVYLHQVKRFLRGLGYIR